MSSRAPYLVAKHEAAHAVVSVRLGLPLASTDIKRRICTDGEMLSVPDGEVGISQGFTTLVEGVTIAWQEALPDPDAEESLRRVAVEMAAGIVAEMERWAGSDDPAPQDDLDQLVHLADVLGIGNSTEQPAVKQWVADSVERATKVLVTYDDGAAWDLVTSALLECEELTGDEVRSIVGPPLAEAEELKA